MFLVFCFGDFISNRVGSNTRVCGQILSALEEPEGRIEMVRIPGMPSFEPILRRRDKDVLSVFLRDTRFMYSKSALKRELCDSGHMSYKTLGRVMDELEGHGVLAAGVSKAGVKYYGFPDLMNRPFAVDSVALMSKDVGCAVVLEGLKINRITPEQEVEMLQRELEQAPGYIRGSPRQKKRYLRNLKIYVRERIMDLDERTHDPMNTQ